MTTIRVDRCETVPAFESLAGEWDALLERSASRSIFLSWAWLFAWWKHFHEGRTLFILTARDGMERLVGVAPFCLQREGVPIALRTVRFLGTEKVSSDYLDLILDPEAEGDVAAALWRGLREGASRWESLRLAELLPDAALVRHWLPLARADRFTWLRLPAQVCPYVPLAESADGFRKSLGPAMRQNYRKKAARLEEIHVTFRSVESAGELPAGLERLYDLHRRRWRTRDLPGNFEDPRVLAFHAEVAALFAPRGRIRLHELHNGDRAVASLYEYQFKDVAFCYQTGFDPVPPDARLPATKYSPGVVVIGRSMEAAIARGLREFDFLRGPERYKAEWSRAYRRTETLFLVPPGLLKARLELEIERAWRAMKGVVKRALRRPDPSAPPAASPAPPQDTAPPQTPAVP